MGHLWVAWTSVSCQLLIFLAGCAVPRRLDQAKIWVMFWAITYFIMNLSARYLGIHHLYNGILNYITLPIHAVQILMALSYWQRSATARLTIRLSIPFLVVAIIALSLTVEDINLPSAIAEPVYSLAALGTATFTLVSLGVHEEKSVFRQAWFWVCAGLILHFATLSVMTPIAKATVLHDLALYTKVVMLRLYINIVAQLLIVIGILCPLTTSSGRSS